MYIGRKQLSKGKLFLLGLASLFAIVYLCIPPIPAEPADASVYGETRKIVIDPGHGGADGGAVGANSEVEKDINLSIALKLRDLLELNGFETIMTREDDRSIHDKKYQTTGDQKVSDIRNRLKLINKNSDALVLSIHQNKFTESQYSGAQMFYGVKHPQSQVLAEYLQRAFVKNLQPENTRQIKEGPNTVYLLQQAETPMVLVECGFLSNQEEAALLTDEEYQDKVAFTIFNGLLDYLENNGILPDNVEHSEEG